MWRFLFLFSHNLHWLLLPCPTSEWGLCGGFPAFRGNSCRWGYAKQVAHSDDCCSLIFTTENTQVLSLPHRKRNLLQLQGCDQQSRADRVGGGRNTHSIPTRWATTHKNQHAHWSPSPSNTLEGTFAHKWIFAFRFFFFLKLLCCLWRMGATIAERVNMCDLTGLLSDVDKRSTWTVWVTGLLRTDRSLENTPCVSQCRRWVPLCLYTWACARGNGRIEVNLEKLEIF